MPPVWLERLTLSWLQGTLNSEQLRTTVQCLSLAEGGVTFLVSPSGQLSSCQVPGSPGYNHVSAHPSSFAYPRATLHLVLWEWIPWNYYQEIQWNFSQVSVWECAWELVWILRIRFLPPCPPCYSVQGRLWSSKSYTEYGAFKTQTQWAAWSAERLTSHCH